MIYADGVISMKKIAFPIIIGVLGAGAFATVLLMKRSGKAKNGIITLAKAGIPDQLDMYDDAHFENTKMMSEGSHYGIDYFNAQREK